MSLVGLLTACFGKSFTNNNYRFEKANVQTPLGQLSIDFKGTQHKLSSREWVTESPWRLVLVLTASSNSTDDNCTASIRNFSLQGADGNNVTILSTDQVLMEPVKLHSDTDTAHKAIWIIMDREFPHQDYRLSLSLSTDGSCSDQLNNHNVSTDMVSLFSVDKSSQWDALMGI